MDRRSAAALAVCDRAPRPRLASVVAAGPGAPTLLPLARIAPVVALSAACSFATGPGLTAAAITVPWLIFTIAVALVGLRRIVSRRSLREPGVAIDAGLAFLAVGGSWLTISRAGLNPLGFSDAIVQLTAVHFHYAGFALPIVAGLVTHQLKKGSSVPGAVIAGVPLTAIGITAGGNLEWFAATFMALAGLATAIYLTRIGIEARGVAQVLIIGAGLSLTAGMSLALGWAWAIKFGWDYLGLEGMAATHGSLNALGFGLLGLIGLNLASTEAGAEYETEVAVVFGRPSDADLTRIADRAVGHATTNEPGLLNRPLPDGFRHKVWQQTIQHDDFDRATNAIREWAGHDAAGISRWPEKPQIAIGETLAIGIPVGPLAVLGTSRIVDVVDEPTRYGFTYATLPHHPADGEESFIIERQPNGPLTVTVTAVWRGAILANYLCPPLTDFLQSHAIELYLEGIATGGAPINEHVARC